MAERGKLATRRARTILGLPAKHVFFVFLAQTVLCGAAGMFLGMRPDVLDRMMRSPVGPVLGISTGRILLAILVSTVLCQWWIRRRSR